MSDTEMIHMFILSKLFEPEYMKHSVFVLFIPVKERIAFNRISAKVVF